MDFMSFDNWQTVETIFDQLVKPTHCYKGMQNH